MNGTAHLRSAVITASFRPQLVIRLVTGITHAKNCFIWVHLVLIPTKLVLEFQIPIRWPASRDEVWKANIPHTHLAQEKSDQNWMVVNGEKINFPGGGTHFHDGADKYIIALAKVYYLLEVA